MYSPVHLVHHRSVYPYLLAAKDPGEHVCGWANHGHFEVIYCRRRHCRGRSKPWGAVAPDDTRMPSNLIVSLGVNYPNLIRQGTKQELDYRKHAFVGTAGCCARAI